MERTNQLLRARLPGGEPGAPQSSPSHTSLQCSGGEASGRWGASPSSSLRMVTVCGSPREPSLSRVSSVSLRASMKYWSSPSLVSAEQGISPVKPEVPISMLTEAQRSAPTGLYQSRSLGDSVPLYVAKMGTGVATACSPTAVWLMPFLPEGLALVSSRPGLTPRIWSKAFFSSEVA